MPVKLIVAAQNWESKEVKCTFTVLADEVILVAKDPSKRIYELPDRTRQVRVVAKPTANPDKTIPYWETRVALVVANNGVVSPGTGFAPWVAVTKASGATSGAMLMTVRVSRFRDVTGTVRDLLKVVPGTPGTRRVGGAPAKPELVATYGNWPPGDLDIHPLPKVHSLDVANPVKPGGILNFKASPVAVDADSVVLELAGFPAPRLFGVVWPDAVPRKVVGAPPTPFFFYIRQTGGQDRKNVFVSGGVTGTYPYNFDYAERCLFESQHYSATPITMRKGWMLRAKGVPYQIASSGAKVVSVYPVADSDDSISYGVLSNFDEMGRLLAELQAFMFWTVGNAAPPSTVGKTAIAAFSSANGTLVSWLNTNGTSKFLKDHISAVYFLDPPGVNECVDAGIRWRRTMGSDKRVRLYSARDNPGFLPAYARLLGLKSTAALPAMPYLQGADDNKITMALFPLSSWQETLKEFGITAFGARTKRTPDGWEYWDAHHLVPATVLTHALSDHLGAGRDV